MRRIGWANVVIYVFILGTSLFTLLLGILGSGYWRTPLGPILLGLWLITAAVFLHVRIRKDARRRELRTRRS